MAVARGLTIGEAAACLAADFPGVNVAVLRRLESAGKFTAARTPSGYRRYSDADLDLIRIVLSDAGAGPEGAAGRDPVDLSGAEPPSTLPAAGPARQGADADVPGAQRPSGARTASRAARTAASRVPAARGSGQGRTQAPAIAALFDVPPGTAPGAHVPGQVPAHAQAAAAVSRSGRAARYTEVSQRPEPSVAAPESTAPQAAAPAASADQAAAPSALAAPSAASASAPAAPSGRRADRRWPDAEFFTPDLGEVALDRDQLAAAARTDRAWVDGLVEYGVLSGSDYSGGADLLVARASAELAQFGVEPRHLRAVAASAARVAELIAAATTAGAVRDPARRERAALAAPGRSAEAAAAAVRLHAALVRAALLRG